MTRLAFLLPLLLPLALLPGCQTLSPEAKVRARLVEAGIKPRVAECLAERLVDDLSLGQLQALGEALKVPGRDVRAMSFRELSHRLRAIGDPEIVAVATRAGIGCAIAG